jgi:Ni/Co efflux regulator RcnB
MERPMKRILPLLLAASALALSAVPAAAQYGARHDDGRQMSRDHRDNRHHQMRHHHRQKVCWVRHHHRVCQWR